MILSAGGSTSHHLNQGIHQDVCRRSGRTAGDASPGADHSTHAPGLKMGAFVSHSAFFFLHARWCEVCCRKGEEKSCCKSFNKATWGTTNSSTSKASWTLQRNALFTFIYIILLHFEDAKVASECDNRENWLSCSFANAFCSSSTLLTTNSIPGEMARHITIQSLEYMHRFSIFLWHTVTGAAQKRLLSALLGSYVLNTHRTTRIYSAILWPCPDCKSSIFHATPPCTCPFAAMSCEVQLNTLQGGVITLEVVMTATVRELKAMLLEKHPCQDLIERKVLKVELLRDSSIIDDAETLDAAGLLGAETLVTVTYTRNEVEASTKHDIHTQGCFGVKIPSNVTSISEAAFKNSHQLVLLTIPESVSHIGAGCLFKLHLSGEHHLGWVCDSHWGRCLSKLHLSGEHHFGWVCDSRWKLCLWVAPLCQASPWVSLWLTLETLPLMGAALWRASLWVSLWLTLGESVNYAFEAAALCRASLWVSLWLTLGTVPLRLHLSGEHHFGWVCDSHWVWCLSRLHLSGEHHFGWVGDSHWERRFSKLSLFGECHLGRVCDSDWGPCLCTLHLSCEHRLGWVCDSNWVWCLSWLHLSGEHPLGWVCDSHWGVCLLSVHLSGEYHLGWVCDSHWGGCLSRLHLSGEHHNSRGIETHFDESVRESFRRSHHHSCKAGQETTARGVSECTDLLWCQCLNDWYNLRKNRRAYGLVTSDELC